MFTLKVTIENHDEVKVNRIPCYGQEAVAQEQARWRAMAPAGSTVLFQVLSGIQR